ncbi:rhomboid-like protein [Kitasatospora azatica]|uniref:rhomboid-like protein n=1 Tax=Kitasatospora azatica TaxID=58347 RepID=UPI0012F7801D|nr:rhomboid-like protein [Kitasatospora azatica]
MADASRGGARCAPVAPYAGLRLGLRTGPLQWVLDRAPTPRRNPFALLYLLVLAGTTVFARLADPRLVHQLQTMSSTDGHHLLSTPVRSLLMSGLWVAGPVWMPYLWAFAFTVAPLERRVGPLRAAGVFAAGHVAGTLLSQLVVGVAVALGKIGPGILDELDIGVSYGVLASLGALSGLLTPRGRLLGLTGAVLLIVHQITSDQDLVTAVGHPTALLAGVALWPVLRRPRRGPRGPLRPVRQRSRLDANLTQPALDRA